MSVFDSKQIKNAGFTSTTAPFVQPGLSVPGGMGVNVPVTVAVQGSAAYVPGAFYQLANAGVYQCVSVPDSTHVTLILVFAIANVGATVPTGTSSFPALDDVYQVITAFTQPAVGASVVVNLSYADPTGLENYIFIAGAGYYRGAFDPFFSGQWTLTLIKALVAPGSTVPIQSTVFVYGGPGSAAFIDYTPAVATDWPVVPSHVDMALDELAANAAIHGSGGLPAVVGGAGLGASGSAAPVMGSAQRSGIINLIVAAGVPTTNADLATVTFAHPWTSMETVIIMPYNDPAWSLAYGIVRCRAADVTLGSFKLVSGPVPLPVGPATYQFAYLVG